MMLTQQNKGVLLLGQLCSGRDGTCWEEMWRKAPPSRSWVWGAVCCLPGILFLIVFFLPYL